MKHDACILPQKPLLQCYALLLLGVPLELQEGPAMTWDSGSGWSQGGWEREHHSWPEPFLSTQHRRSHSYISVKGVNWRETVTSDD